MRKTLTTVPPMLAEEIAPAGDPAFDALLRCFEADRTPAAPPNAAQLPILRRDPYYLD
jgi:hypothetical protein